MKISELKKTLKESIREVFREEIKDILLEAVRSPKQTVTENIQSPSQPEQFSNKSKEQLREEYRNVLNNTGTFNSSHITQPLQVTSTDTTSPNSQLPQGEVSLDQISNFFPKR